jgi:hypothetical protein
LSLLAGITKANAPGGKRPLPNPYYDPEMVFPYLFGFDPEPDDAFAGSSYYLEGVMNLAVRTNYKQAIKGLFADITRIGFCSYIPDEPWRFFFFRNRGRGDTCTRFLQPPHKWSELRAASEESEGNDVPGSIKQVPVLYMALLLTMPHRVSASRLRWLATELDEQ